MMPYSIISFLALASLATSFILSILNKVRADENERLRRDLDRLEDDYDDLAYAINEERLNNLNQ